MFCSEVELGKFICSIDIIQYAFRANWETNLTFQLQLHTICGNTVLAFSCHPDNTSHFLYGKHDLVSSENHKVVDFISTKLNPKFSINGFAVDLFETILPCYVEDLLENMHVDSPLIITGWGVGGYLAILSALRLQQAVDVEESNGSKKTKRPICITFGSPLVGDVALQRAISERPHWKSSFLNVVAKTDHVASFYSSKTPYKPFGTFLFCTESGGHSAFEDQESVLAVLDNMASPSAETLELEYYKNILTSISRKVLYRGISELGEFNLNSLKAGITYQFKEIGVLDNLSNNNLVGKCEERQVKMIISKKNAFEPTKKLNVLKISLTYMEWYMKTRRLKGGYYDSYKNAQTKDEIESQQLIVKHQRILNQYYKKFVEEKDLMPQKVGAKLRKRWLYSGNNYRRIVEPLDIAEYYKNGNKDYINNRPNHYKLLEIWMKEDKKDLTPNHPKKKAANLTEDSCFWAHVEEALISLQDLRNGGLGINAEDIVKELERFEAYVMTAIKDYLVSQDVFVKGSSLMKWWNEYKEYKGSSYDSEFAEYINNKTYESYQ